MSSFCVFFGKTLMICNSEKKYNRSMYVEQCGALIIVKDTQGNNIIQKPKLRHDSARLLCLITHFILKPQL